MDASSFRFGPRRPLGRTHFVASQLGIGDLSDHSAAPEALVATLHRALDAGLNVIDTAPNYEDGYSEMVVGMALKGRREGVFLIDKIDHHDKPVAPQLEESLVRLGLPSVDLLVFHGISSLAVWHRVGGRGGGMEEAREAIKAGKARFRGISSHHPEVLVAAIESGQCDVVMFPVGPFCDGRYLTEVLPLAKERNVGTVCFKAFGAGKLLGDTEGYGRPIGEAKTVPARPVLPRLSVEECIRCVLTFDPDVALLGMSNRSEQDQAFQAASRFEPMSPEELADVRRRATEAINGKGQVWWNP
ncbi:MAG TPA: aldo/keto reductase [Myxococcales bacterium]|jgi:aryl-alcohol dehydrogenase-like predicted oxidoreductase